MITIGSYNCNANVIDHKWWFKEHDANEYDMYKAHCWVHSSNVNLHARDCEKNYKSVNGVILISTLRYMHMEKKRVIKLWSSMYVCAGIMITRILMHNV